MIFKFFHMCMSHIACTSWWVIEDYVKNVRKLMQIKNYVKFMILKNEINFFFNVQFFNQSEIFSFIWCDYLIWLICQALHTTLINCVVYNWFVTKKLKLMWVKKIFEFSSFQKLEIKWEKSKKYLWLTSNQKTHFFKSLNTCMIFWKMSFVIWNFA